jgi:hypothetical protein
MIISSRELEGVDEIVEIPMSQINILDSVLGKCCFSR